MAAGKAAEQAPGERCQVSTAAWHTAPCPSAAGYIAPHCPTGTEEHVAQSPYPLRVLPAWPSARRCEVAGAGRSSAVAGQLAEFEVVAHDEHGNRCAVFFVVPSSPTAVEL